MGGDTFGGVGEEGLEEITKKEPLKAIVVEDVRLLKRTFIVDVPKYRTVDQIRYNIIEENTTKYNRIEKDTTEYIRKVVETKEFIRKEEDTIKYKLVEKEYEVERPVPVDKRYERPVIVDKEYIIATYKDVDALKDLLSLIPRVMNEMEMMKAELAKMKDYKLVEEVLRVPKVKWIPTKTERIVWKDVNKERCEKCRGEVG